MAIPNLLNTVTVSGKSAGAKLTNAATDLLLNAAASGLSYRVNFIQVSNVDATTAYTVSLTIRKASGTSYALTSPVLPLAAGQTVPVLTGTVTLEEGDSIQGLCSTTLKAEVIINYDILSLV